MKAAIRTFVGWAARVGISAEVLAITLCVGIGIGFLIMALAMVALMSSPEALHLVQAAARRAL